MVTSNEHGGLIFGLKLSSVGPGWVTGQDVVHEPSDMDLAMKMHYIKGIYYFESKAFEGLSIKQIKEPLFKWFNHFFITAGRFRRTECGRPYIKCNDCGARFIEAQCEKRLDEWLEMKNPSLEMFLVSNNHLGPDLAFSPLVYLQFTRFKCGGMAMGLSMAHVLGDVFSASEYINSLGELLSGNQPSMPINVPRPLAMARPTSSPRTVVEDPVSIKRVSPVGDNWIIVNNCKMEAFSFYVTPTTLCHMQAKISDTNDAKFSSFESLCAIFWQHIAKIRHGDEPKVITIIRKGSETKGLVGNAQIISVVQADFTIHKADPAELALMIKNHAADERKKIEDAMERDEGLADFLVYGANLTFVNLEEANFYGFEIKGEKPLNVSYLIDGIGDNGAVLVLPVPSDPTTQGGFGRLVTLILPKDEVMELKSELKKEWNIV